MKTILTVVICAACVIAGVGMGSIKLAREGARDAQIAELEARVVSQEKQVEDLKKQVGALEFAEGADIWAATNRIAILEAKTNGYAYAFGVLYMRLTNCEDHVVRVESTQSIQQQVSDLREKATSDVHMESAQPVASDEAVNALTDRTGELNENIGRLQNSMDDLYRQQMNADMLIEYQLLFPPPPAWKWQMR